MEVTFKVYTNGGKLPIISLNEPPGKKKYTNRGAKLEAIKRVSGEELSPTLSLQEVNQYITSQYYGKPIFKEFQNVLNEVSKEKTINENDNYIFLYTVDVEFNNTINKEDLTDPIILRFVQNEIMGNPLPEFKKRVNPILSLSKNGPEKKSIDEAFTELITKRNWYKNSPYDRRTASYDKEKFTKGELSYERKRIYLESAGYGIIQPEEWIKKYI